MKGATKMKIEICGPGCPKCQATEKNVRQAVEALGISAEVSHVTDVAEMGKRGVMFTPAVVVDDQVKVSGKVPSVEELKKLLSG